MAMILIDHRHPYLIPRIPFLGLNKYIRCSPIVNFIFKKIEARGRTRTFITRLDWVV